MADEFKFDFEAITVEEYRRLFDKSQTQDEEDDIIAKTIGLTGEDIRKFSQAKYRRFLRAFFKAASAPVDENPT